MLPYPAAKWRHLGAEVCLSSAFFAHTSYKLRVTMLTCITPLKIKSINKWNWKTMREMAVNDGGGRKTMTRTQETQWAAALLDTVLSRAIHSGHSGQSFTWVLLRQNDFTFLRLCGSRLAL